MNVSMDYTEFILVINAGTIAILTLFTVLLLASSKFRGMNGYAALVTFVPTVPVYLYNMSRMLSWHGLTQFIMPFSCSVNTMLMPLLWILTQVNYDPEYRWNFRKYLHFLPALVFFVLICLMDSQQRMDIITYEMTGDDNWLGDLNVCVILLQMLIYYPAIFIYIAKARKRIMQTSSDAEWLQKQWVYRFQILFFVCFVIVQICYLIWPRTDAWLIQIINVISMTYLVWCSLTQQIMPMADVESVAESTRKDDADAMPLDEMKAVCENASAYLSESKAYLRPDITLSAFAKEAGISSRVLSRSINGYMKVNFFEFINRMRVEEAKRLLPELETKGYNIDSIYEECGFRSRSTFFFVFKKMEGVSPAVWLEKSQKSGK